MEYDSMILKTHLISLWGSQKYIFNAINASAIMITDCWLGDILPQGQNAPKTKCPMDILPQDILPQIAQTFWRWTYCPQL